MLESAVSLEILLDCRRNAAERMSGMSGGESGEVVTVGNAFLEATYGKVSR